MSHITIIISKGTGGGNLAEADAQPTTTQFTPDDGLSNKEIAREVLKRLDWLDKLDE